MGALGVTVSVGEATGSYNSLDEPVQKGSLVRSVQGPVHEPVIYGAIGK